jgi:hypothetical protein
MIKIANGRIVGAFSKKKKKIEVERMCATAKNALNELDTSNWITKVRTPDII